MRWQIRRDVESTGRPVCLKVGPLEAKMLLAVFFMQIFLYIINKM